MAKIEPQQAIVRDADGVVTDVLVCDQATANLFAQWFPDFYPGCSWHDATGLGVGVGWSFASGRTPAFRPAQPGEGWTWNEDTHVWDAPPPPPDPEPAPEQPASAEEPAAQASSEPAQG